MKDYCATDPKFSQTLCGIYRLVQTFRKQNFEWEINLSGCSKLNTRPSRKNKSIYNSAIYKWAKSTSVTKTAFNKKKWDVRTFAVRKTNLKEKRLKYAIIVHSQEEHIITQKAKNPC